MRIEDFTGNGYGAKVGKDKRLYTQAAVSSELHENSLTDEQVYMFSSGEFTSITTTGTETGVFYVKNNSQTKKLFLSSIRTCGDQIQKVTFYKNATGGTLITDETAASVENLNYTSSNIADASVYRGADSKTVTGGTWFGQHINQIGHSVVDTRDAIVLGRNDSLSITFELAIAGNVCVAIVGYFE